MTTSDELLLRVFETKGSRKISGPLRVENAEYRSRWNDELYEIYGDIDKVQQIKKQRLARLYGTDGYEYSSFEITAGD